MKTFKMLSFEYLSETGIQAIPLIDGIIINQENSHNAWILELYTSTEHRALFNALLASQQVFDARVIISFPDNDHAPFSLVVTKITDVQGQISVLCRGTLKAQRKRYAERLLQELIADGLSNDELLVHFEKGMKERPRLKNS